jgi:hypothetical protein
MKAHRLTLAAWQMLQRLGQPNTSLRFSQCDGRFYFVLREECVDLVRTSTIEALNTSGMVRRERNISPSYVISDKGLTALRNRMPLAELDLDEYVIPRITVDSQITKQ